MSLTRHLRPGIAHCTMIWPLTFPANHLFACILLHIARFSSCAGQEMLFLVASPCLRMRRKAILPLTLTADRLTLNERARLRGCVALLWPSWGDLLLLLLL